MFFFVILFYWFFLILYIFLTVCSLSSGSSWYFIFLASKLFFVLLSNAPLLSACLMDFLPLISFERTKSQGKYCHKKILYNFYLLPMKTSTLVETNHLETFQVFEKMNWLLEFPVIGSRCENLILLRFYLQISND